MFKGFFGNLKKLDEHLQFVFFTGVTKFSKISIFSDLNQLRDISLEPQFDTICGLTEEELQALGAIKLKNPNVALARDLFLFGCWTGISFIDIKNLTTDNIVEMNGALWIVSKRQKTGVPFQVKLMDIPMQIIKRYEPFRKDKRLFNIGSLDMVNKRIKKVAKMCGIKKRISFHVSRHSFAVLALNYGMPIESVSKILGHTDIATTQIYAKVTSTKLEHDISAFESRIKGHMPTMGGMA